MWTLGGKEGKEYYQRDRKGVGCTASLSFSSPEPTILLACSRNRELWEQPFQACAIDADCVKLDGQNSVISFVISKWLLPELSFSDRWSRGTKTLGLLVRDTKNVSDFVQKHFVSATNVSQFAQHGNTTFIWVPHVCAPKKHHGQQCIFVCQGL